MFKINDNVLVRSPRKGDYWKHAFQGFIKSKKVDGCYIVEDQDGDCWDVDECMISKDPTDGYGI